MITNRLLFLVFFAINSFAFSQYTVSGVVSSEDQKNLQNVEIYNEKGKLLAQTNQKGFYKFTSNKTKLTLVFYAPGFHLLKKTISVLENTTLPITLQSLSEQLSEIEILGIKRKVFALKQLKKIEGTAIYAGKKSEVVLIDEVIGNKASNNARQIYSQVVGLNIYENDDAGLQLNIGGRGLDPNRTANFNTRQNGYDMSADVLGYPESYYTPPADALQEIQVVRGAASLQYGTQFGGLLNFKFKKPIKNKEIELITRQSAGSYGLFNSFNSLSGTVGKTAYYGYANYKRGNGFRPNSNFNSINIYALLEHHFSKKTSLALEATYLNYLAKQAGGLTDTQFKKNIFFSDRTRNWFKVNWNLWAVKFKHNFSDNTKFSLNLFGLNASRTALGFRTAPIDFPDVFENGKFIYNRDLIIGEFKNWGAEARFLSDYYIAGKKHTYLVGAKFYKANNSEKQGAGTKKADADFSYAVSKKNLNSNFRFPNKNIALFGETILNISEKFSVTPGFRVEYIKTESLGKYITVLVDGAGKPLPGGTFKYDDNRTKERDFILLGIGTSYKPSSSVEFYANISQNYRSVTFSDIRTVSPTFVVDENIDDEKGGTADFGLRGKIKKIIAFDIGGFGLFYNNRIGVVIADKGKHKGDRLRTNVGDAFIYGFESFTDINLARIFSNNKNYVLSYFVNLALTSSEYTKSIQAAVKGKKVEFIPAVNLKTGGKFGYKNFLGSLQFTYLTEQFTDATNALPEGKGALREGTIGTIPAYSILDVSLSYSYKKWRLETGVNNALNKKYFTRRATGYPGPGIIPSSPRSFYVTIQLKL